MLQGPADPVTRAHPEVAVTHTHSPNPALANSHTGPHGHMDTPFPGHSGSGARPLCPGHLPPGHLPLWDRLLIPAAAGATSAGAAGYSLFVYGRRGNGDGPQWSHEKAIKCLRAGLWASGRPVPPAPSPLSAPPGAPAAGSRLPGGVEFGPSASPLLPGSAGRPGDTVPGPGAQTRTRCGSRWPQTVPARR